MRYYIFIGTKYISKEIESSKIYIPFDIDGDDYYYRLGAIKKRKQTLEAEFGPKWGWAVIEVSKKAYESEIFYISDTNEILSQGVSIPPNLQNYPSRCT